MMELNYENILGAYYLVFSANLYEPLQTTSILNAPGSIWLHDIPFSPQQLQETAKVMKNHSSTLVVNLPSSDPAIRFG